MTERLAIPKWDSKVPESSLSMRVAPRADDWRYAFDAGSSLYAQEVRKAISDREFDTTDPHSRLLQFGTEDAVVAHLVVGSAPAPHPRLKSKTEKPYVALDYFEVATAFQKKLDPGGRGAETYAAVIVRYVEENLVGDIQARARLPRRKSIVGMYAITRVGNDPAGRLLERLGFQQDEDNPFPDAKTRLPSLLYRKIFDAK